MSDKKTVSLVLGSGGARGLAHIGVIEWLEQNGYRIESIAGSSMGALIGGIYAAGELDTYKNWVTALDKSDVVRLLDLSFGWSGLFKGDRVIERLQDLIGDRAIEDLPISFTAVATDVEKEKEVWLSKGQLFDAIRASIAVPLIFTPHRINGVRLLDGGLLNPLPIAPTLRDQTDLTIAVNVDGRPADADGTLQGRESIDVAAADGEDDVSDYREKIDAFIKKIADRFGSDREEDWDFFDVMTLSIETMQNAIVRMKLAAYTPDHIISISRDAARGYEFYRARELIELGRRTAGQVLSPESAQ
jgi:NTE family protein